MRFRLMLALSASVLLILGATWTRFDRGGALAGSLVAVDEPAQIDTAPTSADTTEVSDISPKKVAEAPLTDTDLVTRQLFSNYLNMAYKGQITPDNVNALAESYAESIASLNKASRVGATDLNIVATSPSTLKTYADSLGALYSKYQNLLAHEFDNTPSISQVTPALATFSNRVGALYEREADELKLMPVPQTMLGDHLALVNNYLRNAADYRSVAKVNSNPVDAMAGIAMAAKNINEESTLIQSLKKNLSVSGIILSIQ